MNRAFEELNLQKHEKLGKGKTAVVFAGATQGGHRRAVRLFRLGEDFETKDYEAVGRSIEAKHSYIHKLMPDRVPRLYKLQRIPSKRSKERTLALGQVMAWVDGPTLGSMEPDRLTDEMRSDLRQMLHRMWSNRISHGDLFEENVIYNIVSHKWTVLDLDNIKIHLSSFDAKKRDLYTMDSRLKDALFSNERMGTNT